MDLRATINGIQYDILQGATFAEEFNETLDSGSIIINNVQKIRDLMPYDDVFIYSFTDPEYKFKGYPFDSDNPRPKFYKHLLVDQFTEEVLRLGDREEDGRYKYKIELMSETKKLETIQLPNISVTQPIKGEKRSVYKYAEIFVNLYSPTYKKAVYKANGDNSAVVISNEWADAVRYTLAPELKNIFDNVYSPDFVLNTPTLRALLSKLFLVKDMIPYVQDDVIYAMDISKRGNKFDANPKYVNIITGSRTSDNHCDNLRRNYTDALSRDRSCRSVEYVGFRNSDNALMTIANMRLELGMPIYKINKIYLCYYKNIKVNYLGAKDSALASKGVEDGVMLCKQDISKLVKLNTERNLLSQDWENLQEKNPPQSVDDMAKYKFCTVGYDIGSKYITGWGDIYTYPTFWNDNKYTAVQNIVSKMDYFYPFGIYDEPYVAKQFGEGVSVYSTIDDSFWTSVVTKKYTQSNGSVDMFFNTVESVFTNPSLKLKGLFFIVDYEGFYNGTIVHSKKNERDDIVINDNASESLTLIEQDAIYQTEKVNRFGNKALQINARYDSFFDSNGNELLQPLASVYESSYEDDVVIYHREYSIFNNCVQCTYYGTKNYVLKNWFTSVYARYRTWNLMSYNESVKRSENEKNYIFWSEKESYYENKAQTLFNNYKEVHYALKEVLSCLVPWTIDNVSGIYEFTIDSKINCATIRGNRIGEAYLADLNAFVANNSLCFNIKTFDNFSQGVYISQAEPMIGKADSDGTEITPDSWIKKAWNYFVEPATSDYSGSKQDYYSLVNNIGETQNFSFEVGKQTTNIEPIDFFKSSNDKTVLSGAVTSAYKQLLAIPNQWGSKDVKLRVRKDFYKDNKSYMDMTMQVENFSLSKNVIVAPWVMKLSDLLADYPKFDQTFVDTTRPINGGYQIIVSEFDVPQSDMSGMSTVMTRAPFFTLKVSKSFVDSSVINTEYDTNFNVQFWKLDLLDLYAQLNILSAYCIFLISFKCTKISFRGNNKERVDLRGKLKIAYKNDSNVIVPAEGTDFPEIDFVFVLQKQGAKQSLASSIMPGANQNADNYGELPSSDMSVFYSGIDDHWDGIEDNIKPNYADAYGADLSENVCFPRHIGSLTGGYEAGTGWIQNHFRFNLADKHGNSGNPSSWQIVTIFGVTPTATSSWENKNILSLPSFITGGDIISDPARYATYHKNMFLHYSDTIDSKFLQEEYKYSEIDSRESHTELVFGKTGNIANTDGYFYSGSLEPEGTKIENVTIKTDDGTKATASYRDGKIFYKIYSGNNPGVSVSATIIYSSVVHWGNDWDKNRRVSDYFVPVFDLRESHNRLVSGTTGNIVDVDGYYYSGSFVPEGTDIENVTIKADDATKATASYSDGKIFYRIYSGNKPGVSINATISYSSIVNPPYILLPSIHRVKNSNGAYVDNKLIWDAQIETLFTYDSTTMPVGRLYAPFPSDINNPSDILIVSNQKNCFRVTAINKDNAGNIELVLQKDKSLTVERIKSLSYWYLDDFKNGYQKDIDNMGYISKFDYDPTNCYLHFVFGVNIPGENEIADIRSVPRKIYLSLMTKKDLRVFDRYHQVVGKVENEAITRKYGKGQYFTKKS